MATTISTDSPKLTANIADHADVYGGRGLDFDGATDYLLSDDNGNAMGMGSNPYSISAWVKVADATNNQTYTYFSACSVGSSQPRFLLQITTLSGTNSLKAVYEKSGSNLTVSIDEPMDTEWHHLVFVEESDAIRRFYKDGKLVGTDTTSYETDTGYVDYVMGNARTINQWFDGSMSDVKLFNTALSLEQIQELYLKPEQSAPSAVQSNLKVWYPMCEGLAQSVVYDHSGNNHHAVEGGGSSYGILTGQEEPTIPQVPLMRYNKKMTFDAVDDFVSASDTSLPSGSNARSFSCWIRNTRVDAWKAIIHYGTSSNNQSNFISIGDASDGYKLHMAGFNNTADGSTDAIPDNELCHIAVVYASNAVNYYINGASSGGDSSFTGINTVLDGTLAIGKNKYANTYINALIDEVAIFNTALTQPQVAELYNSGLALDATAHSESGNLVGYWRNDGVTQWKDRSTNSNDGNVQGSPDSITIREGSTSGKDGLGFPFKNDDKNVLRLNGVNEYLQIDDSDVFSFGDSVGDLPFTISAWIKPRGASALFRILDKSTSTSAVEYNLSIDSSSKCTLALYDSSTSNVIYRPSSSSIVADQWTFVTATYNGSGSNSGINIYINDALNNGTASSGGSYTGMHNTTSTLKIGIRKFDDSFGNGLIDEVRIYNRALSATEVSKNYKHGKGKHKNS